MAKLSESAFPRLTTKRGTSGAIDRVEVAGGLTKRELFAAMVMQGLVAANVKVVDCDMHSPQSNLAHSAVAIADALISELKKSDGDIR